MPTTLETAPLPTEMHAKLASVRSRLRFLSLSQALERAALALVGAAIISFVLDTTLEPDLNVRRPFTYFLLASAIATGGAFVYLTLRRRLTEDSVAVMVEQVYPELEDGLVSSVQLSRDLARGGLGHVSPALIRSTIARTAAKSSGLDFGRVVDPSSLLPATFLLLGALAGIGLFVAQPTTRALALAWWQRCVLGEEVGYPKAVELSVSVPGERDGVTAVARGDDVAVDISVTRGARKVERLVVKTWLLKNEDGRYRARGRPEETRLVQVGPESGAKFRKLYQNVTEPFDFVVDAGSHVTSSKHRVVVVDRPRVEEARFWLSFPEYTSLRATPREKPETQPDLRVPVGTEVEYRVLANKPLARATLVFERDDPKAPKPAPGQPAVTIEEAGPLPEIGGKDQADKGKLDRRVLTGKFTVKQSLRFHFSLVSQDDYDDGKKPVVFSVTAVVDRPPEVKIVVPGRPKQVTPRAIVPLEIDVRDDYGVASAELRLKVEAQDGARPASGKAGEDKVPLAGLEDGTRTALLKHSLDLAELGLHAQDRVTYRAVAFDRNIETEKRMGESASYLLSVIAPEDLARLLQDRLQRVKDDLVAIAKLEKQAREDTDALVRPLVAKTKLDEEDKRRLLLADYGQRKVTSRLSAASQELERIVEERELNRLGDQQELDREKEIRDAARELADRDSPLVSRELDDARRSPELDARTKARLAQVPDLQDRLELAILAVAARIEKWANFADVINDFRNLLRDHEAVMSSTENEVKKSGRDGSK